MLERNETEGGKKANPNLRNQSVGKDRGKIKKAKRRRAEERRIDPKPNPGKVAEETRKREIRKCSEN